MAKLRVTASAKSDLRSIAEYSRQNWGKNRARKYMASLHVRFREMAAKEPSGKNCDGFRPGLRSVKHASHVIYYFFEGDEVFVINVLHGAMDPQRHLDLPD